MILEIAKASDITEATVKETLKLPKFLNDLESVTLQDSLLPVISDRETTPVTYIITRNECLEGDEHPISGVPFERKIVVQDNGEIMEGVFPVFNSAFDAKIPSELYLESDYKQFKECNTQLLDYLKENPKVKELFSEEQLEQIKDGTKDGSAPDGYVWHHKEESGVIQLVKYDDHAYTGHTGGRSIWGGGHENR